MGFLLNTTKINRCQHLIIDPMDPNKKRTSEAEDSFVLTDDRIKKIIKRNGTWVDFYYELRDDDMSKLRDSHVIDLLSNPDHIDKQKVTHINLSGYKGITDDSLAYIADHFPQLEELWLINTCRITDKGIIAVTGKCHKLTELDYSYCSKVTNAALEAIVSNLPQLEVLYSQSCNISVLPDDFGDKLKHLRRLYLYDNNIKTLPASIGNLKHLKVLKLSGNNITALPASITNLAGTCQFGIDGNLLQDPPLDVLANQGIEAIKRYFKDSEIMINNVRIRIPPKVNRSVAEYAMELALHVARNGIGEGTKAKGFLIVLAATNDYKNPNFGGDSEMNKFKGKGLFKFIVKDLFVKDWEKHSPPIVNSFGQDGAMIINRASGKFESDSFNFQLKTKDANATVAKVYKCLAIECSADDCLSDGVGKGSLKVFPGTEEAIEVPIVVQHGQEKSEGLKLAAGLGVDC